MKETNELLLGLALPLHLFGSSADTLLDCGLLVDRHNRQIEEGSVCSIVYGGVEVFVIVRGSSRSDASILFDEKLRARLKVDRDKTYDFQITRADFCGQVRWALGSSDVRFSFPARISLVSAALGLLSVLIALICFIH